MRSSENYGYSLEKAMQYRKSRTSERKIVLERIILLVFQYFRRKSTFFIQNEFLYKLIQKNFRSKLYCRSQNVKNHLLSVLLLFQRSVCRPDKAGLHSLPRSSIRLYASQEFPRRKALLLFLQI